MKKVFNKPDLNAPRFRPKWKQVMSKNLFEEFKKKFPEHENIDYAFFKNIISSFNGELVQGVIDNRDGIESPERMGVSFIANCTWGKNKKINNIDFGESRKLGITVTHQNWDSNNKLMKIFYSNFGSRYRILHKKIWQFKMSKPNRQKISTAFKKQANKYITINDKKKVSGIFNDFQRRDSILAKGAVAPKGYDEFKMD